MKVMLFSVLVYMHFETCFFLKRYIYHNYTLFFIYFSIFVVYLLYHIKLISLSGDIELNPGLKPSSFKYFSVCHWELNSITPHDFLKLLTAYNVMHKFDIICISESYFNSDTSSSDHKLNIPGYNVSRADHPSRNRRGGVCIYYRVFTY